MKEVNWYNFLPQSWKEQKIKYLFSIVSGNGFPVDLQGRKNEKYPFAKAGTISSSNKYLCFADNTVSQDDVDKFSFNIIPVGSIVLPKIGEALKKNSRAITKQDCCIDNNCQAMIPNCKIDSTFGFYLLSVLDMNWYDNKGTIPSVNNKRLKNDIVPLPPYAEQQQIVSYLDAKCDAIDKAITRKRSVIETLKEYRTAVITKAVTKGLNSDVEMKSSSIVWIGEVPVNWKEQKIKYLFSIVSGNGFPIDLQGRKNEKYPFAKAGTISSSNKYLHFADNTVSQDDVDKYKFNIIPIGSVVLPKIGEALKKNSRAITVQNCCIDNNCQAMIPNAKLDSNYGFYLLSVLDMNWYDNKGTIPSINNKKLKNDLVPLPPFLEQQQIASYLDAKCSKIDSAIQQQEQIIAKLEEYRKSVIYYAVTGKIDYGKAV